MMLPRHRLNSCLKLLPSRLFRTTYRYISYKEGDVIHDYKVKKVVDVPEFFLTAVDLEHTRTRTKHLHLSRDDKNNVFNVLIPTVPMDSTGVAHILEHVVLCGSEKFPVRDPFFKMLDRSVASFMNAMTGADYTMYPFASQNPTDFKNLLSVYLNSVFFPRIREIDFLQEGWRLEHERNDDNTSPIIFKGVVFNEMKGYMADPSYLHGTELQNNLLPDHTYGFNSGGKPLEIPNLTWNQLKAFHRHHFHPSNARFMTYGDIPLEDHLERINAEVLNKFSGVPPNPDVPLQARWIEPRRAEITCPADKMAANPDKQSTFSMSFLLSDVSDVYETFVASVVCSLLTDGPSSLLYKSLIESGLGSDYSPMTGYHSSLREGVFSCGLQGIAEGDIPQVENIITETLQKATEDGFEEERVDAILHQVELSCSHQQGQFGLGLTFNLLPKWCHGADPIVGLHVKSTVARLREHLKRDPHLLRKKCKEYFIKNLHRISLTMKVDEEYKTKFEAHEAALLNNKVELLDTDERRQVFEQGLELARVQNETEDLSCLPSLWLSDIPRQQQSYDVTIHPREGRNPPVMTMEQPTNGVTYLNAVIPLNQIEPELIPLLPLFCDCVTQMGTRTTDYVRFSQREELTTGGLGCGVTSHSHATLMTSHEPCVTLSSHCLDRNRAEMLELWRELLEGFTFENHARLQTLIGQRAQELANSVSFNGHTMAMRSSARSLTPSSYFSELLSGLTQVDFMRKLSESTGAIESTADRLRAIGDRVFRRDVTSGRFALHATPEAMTSAHDELTSFLRTVTSQCEVPVIDSTFSWQDGEGVLPTPEKTVHDLPLAVNFVSTSIRTAPYAHRDCPTLRVLSRLVTTKFLHREIREKGGAYGGGAKQGTDGVWRFYSYRDPNSLQTLDRFADGVRWAADGGFTLQDVDEAKIALFQSIDAPVSPSNRGLGFFSSGVDAATKQLHRERLLDVDREQLMDAAQKYLVDPFASASTIIGPADHDLTQWQRRF